MHPIYDHVPDMVLKEDDIVFVDLGPVFGDIEADFARTYVLGKRCCHFQLHLLPEIVPLFLLCSCQEQIAWQSPFIRTHGCSSLIPLCPAEEQCHDRIQHSGLCPS